MAGMTPLGEQHEELVHVRERGATAVLMLNRPEARNALSLALLEALHLAMDALARRTHLHVLTISGEGRAFCAGMDLKAVLDDADAAEHLLRSLAELTLKIRALPMVTVAKINGAAIGGGCGLACVCDLAVTHIDAKIGYPEVDMGVCPGVVAPWVVKKVGAGRARRILLQGGLMTGAEALQDGLIDHVVATREELENATQAIVERLASGGPHALRATKNLLNRLDGSDDGSLVREGAALSARVLRQPEAQERLRAKMG